MPFEFLILITVTLKKDILKGIESLNKHFDFNECVYVLKNSYHKKPNKNYKEFIDQIIPGHDQFVLSLLILFNQNNEVVYASTYNESAEERIDKIKEIIKQG